MSDIVERLLADRPQFYESTIRDVADEIGDLLLDFITIRDEYRELLDEAAAEIERLRAKTSELAEIILQQGLMLTQLRDRLDPARFTPTAPGTDRTTPPE